MLVGLTDESEIPIDVLDVLDNELDVHGSFRYHNTYATAIDLLADGVVDVECIVDLESPLSEVGTAVDRAIDPEITKRLISIGGRD